MSYLPNAPIKDLQNDRISVGNSEAPCWEVVKMKSPSKVNSRRERLRPVLMQRAEDNMAQVRRTLEGRNNVIQNVSS